jgi:hypothetical protein
MDEKELLNKIIDIISTHEEGDGDYCDTGEDMDWCCRSDCTKAAIERLKTAFDKGLLQRPKL